MSEASTSPPAARARAVAELPLEPLEARAGELARAWALALVDARPPAEIGEVPLTQIALDGPALVLAVLRALGSEAELRQLTGDPAGARAGEAPALRLAALSGADDAAGMVAAVEALRGVLWDALAREMPSSATRYVSDACDRLASVCASTLAAALARGELAQAAGAPPPGRAPLTAGAGPPPRVIDEAVIVDELRSHAARSSQGEDAGAPPDAPSPAIEIRDQRSGEGPAAWIGAIGRRLERFRRDGVPFAVLLAELGELEGLRQREGAAAAGSVAGAVERMLAAELRGPGGPSAGGEGDPPTITCERPGRYWLLAPGADRTGAQHLTERLTHAAASIRTARGQRAQLLIGTASCPQDGREAAALAAHADVGLYAARAAARSAAHVAALERSS